MHKPLLSPRKTMNHMMGTSVLHDGDIKDSQDGDIKVSQDMDIMVSQDGNITVLAGREHQGLRG